MAWSLDLILRIISMIIGLVSIIYGILVITRFAGKLKTAVILLVLSVITTLTLNFLHIFNFPLINLNIIRSIGNLIITIFMLLTLFILRQMIDRIDGKYK